MDSTETTTPSTAPPPPPQSQTIPTPPPPPNDPIPTPTPQTPPPPTPTSPPTQPTTIPLTPQPPPSSTPATITTTSSSSSSSQNPNPNPTPTPTPIPTTTQNPQPITTPPPQPQPQQQQQQQPTPQPRPQINRARPTSNYPSQFSPNIPSSSSSSTTTTTSSTTAFSPSLSTPVTTNTSSIQRGGLAIGVPAHQQRPPSQPAPFSSYGQQSPFNPNFGNLGRNPINVPDSNTNQVKQPIQGIQTTIGNFGSLSSTSQLRPGGVSPHNQARTVQPTMRSQSTPTNQPLANQKFQGHNLMRGSSMGTPTSPSPGTPQGMPSHTQPWMAAPNQGKQMHPPLPSSQFRQQVKPPTVQHRSHLPPQQHHHAMGTVSHQQMPPSQQSQQQSMSQSQMHPSQENYGQPYPGTRVPQSIQHQQQSQRVIGSGNQKISTTTAQAGPIQSGPPSIAGNMDAGESSRHILTKRSIHELVTQIDPSEKLDPEVEDILMEIAEDFVDSITTVGCSLAKHRKSSTLEAKDILLHLERNWHMTLPGFGGDEIKGYKKQLTNDIHKERLAAVKKSMIVSDAVITKSYGGQAAGNVKGHPAKAPATGSPKAREVL